MLPPKDPMILQLDLAALNRLSEATQDVSPVSGLIHTFYRYPARFSPRFVREAIQAFTVAGDLVVDPFMGGGTTLVEATALGRHAVGTDISALAVFVARVKTTLYSETELHLLEAWADSVLEQINMLRLAVYPADWVEYGYLRHLETRRTWRLAKATQQALASAVRLPDRRLENFARCVILRTAQWGARCPKGVSKRARFSSAIEAFLQEHAHRR